MPALNKLHSSKIAGLDVGKKYSDGGGLWLHKRKDGGAQWFLRYTLYGRRHEMGLGRYPTVSLKEARLAAEKYRAKVREGVDPIKDREREKREKGGEDTTFASIAEQAFEAKKPELKGDGKAGRWFSPLTHYVIPKLGKMPVEEISQADVRDAIAPIWHTKGPTAVKALNRTSIVLDYAAAKGLEVDVQAVTKAKALLGKSRHKAKHIPSMPWQEVPEFYASLEEPTTTHLALRFLILTGLRVTPVRRASLSDIEDDVWTIPGKWMKGLEGKTPDFRVPLSPEALRVVELATPMARNGNLFPGERGEVITDATMARLMERRPLEARPHGFRTSLRVWLAEMTNAPHEVAETCVAHSTDSAIVRAYRRTDFLEQRRVLMNRWAQFVTGQEAAKVVRIA